MNTYYMNDLEMSETKDALSVLDHIGIEKSHLLAKYRKITDELAYQGNPSELMRIVDDLSNEYENLLKYERCALEDLKRCAYDAVQNFTPCIYGPPEDFELLQ